MSKNDLALVSVSGTSVLVALKADLDAGNNNGDAWRYDRETKRLHGPQPLQVWFKFGTWPNPHASEEEAAAALEEVAQAIGG